MISDDKEEKEVSFGGWFFIFIIDCKPHVDFLLGYKNTTLKTKDVPEKFIHGAADAEGSLIGVSDTGFYFQLNFGRLLGSNRQK